MPKKMTNVMVDRIDIKKLFGMYNYKIVRGKNNPYLYYMEIMAAVKQQF